MNIIKFECPNHYSQFPHPPKKMSKKEQAEKYILDLKQAIEDNPYNFLIPTWQDGIKKYESVLRKEKIKELAKQSLEGKWSKIETSDDFNQYGSDLCPFCYDCKGCLVPCEDCLIPFKLCHDEKYKDDDLIGKIYFAIERDDEDDFSKYLKEFKEALKQLAEFGELKGNE